MKQKTKKLKGTVHHVDLEGGYFTLRLENGDVYKLDGGDASLRKDGVKAEVEGVLEEKDNSFGIGFGTPILKVKSFKIL